MLREARKYKGRQVVEHTRKESDFKHCSSLAQDDYRQHQVDQELFDPQQHIAASVFQ